MRHRQGETAQPFDGDNPAMFEHVDRRTQRRLAGGNGLARAPFQLGSTIRTGYRLRVKTAVSGIAVLGFTRFTEGKCRH